MNSAKKLREKSLEDLELMDKNLSKDIFKLRSEKRLARKLEKPHALRQKKRERARVLTLLRERML